MREISPTSFAADVLKLASGTTFALLLGILAAPLLTRLYAPEAFGMAALFASITGILSVISCMRYELSIMLPKSDGEAANLLGVSLVFVLLVSLLSIPIIWLGNGPVLQWLNAPGLMPYLWMIPLTVLISGVFLALNYWNSRTRHFGRLSIARVTRSVATTSMTLGAGYAGYATGGTLIGASVAGQAITTSALGRQIWRDDGRLFRQHIRWRSMLTGIKGHRKFPLYDTWSALLNTASWQLPVFLLSIFFSSSVVGYYALGFRILQMPMNLIGSAIGQVFFQRAAEAKVQRSLAFLVEEVFRRLVMIGLFPMLVLTIIGRELYVVVFGQNWAEAGVYTQIISPWAFFWFISSPLSTLFSVLERQEFGLKWNTYLFLTRFGSLGIGGYLGNARLALSIFAATGILLYGYMVLSIISDSGMPLSKLWTILGKELLYSTPYGIVILLLTLMKTQGWILIIAIGISFGIYMLVLLKRQPELFRITGMKAEQQHH